MGNLLGFFVALIFNYVRDKYEAKREGVMEEMEITTAGLEMVTRNFVKCPFK